MSTLFETSPDVTIDAGRQPVVTIKDDRVFANSRDVAEFFGKNHRDILEATDNLLKQLIAEKSAMGNRGFVLVEYEIPETPGRKFRSFDMTRDAFALLVMGFNNVKKVLQWKLRYIEAFNAMEAELRGRPAVDPMRALNDPAWLRNALGLYTEKVLALEASNAAMRAGVEALERIADSNGTFNRTTAAKMLGVTPHTLIRWMRTNGWTYRRPGTGEDIAYQAKIAAGWLEHKIATGPRSDGTEWSSTSVRVTPRGLTILAKAFPAAVRPV
jgi:Rha family phage regulatory protein